MVRINHLKNKCLCCYAAPRERHNTTCERARQTRRHDKAYKTRERSDEISKMRRSRKRRARHRDFTEIKKKRLVRCAVRNKRRRARPAPGIGNEIAHIRCLRANTLVSSRTRAAQQVREAVSHTRASHTIDNEIMRSRRLRTSNMFGRLSIPTSRPIVTRRTHRVQRPAAKRRAPERRTSDSADFSANTKACASMRFCATWYVSIAICVARSCSSTTTLFVNFFTNVVVSQC